MILVLGDLRSLKSESVMRILLSPRHYLPVHHSNLTTYQQPCVFSCPNLFSYRIVASNARFSSFVCACQGESARQLVLSSHSRAFKRLRSVSSVTHKGMHYRERFTDCIVMMLRDARFATKPLSSSGVPASSGNLAREAMQ